MERVSGEYCTEFDLTEENNFNKTRAERTDIASIFTVLNQTVELNCVFSILNFFFQGRDSLSNFDCTRTHSVDRTDLELRDLTASAS